MLAAARELRDRWQEAVEREPWLLEGTGDGGKYDPTRVLPPAPERELKRLAIAA